MILKEVQTLKLAEDTNLTKKIKLRLKIQLFQELFKRLK